MKNLLILSLFTSKRIVKHPYHSIENPKRPTSPVCLVCTHRVHQKVGGWEAKSGKSNTEIPTRFDPTPMTYEILYSNPGPPFFCIDMYWFLLGGGWVFFWKELPTQTSWGKLHDKQQISTNHTEYTCVWFQEGPPASWHTYCTVFLKYVKVKGSFKRETCNDIPAKAKNGQGKGPSLQN